MSRMDRRFEDTGMGSPGRFLTFRLARVQAKLNAQSSRILRDHAGITLTQWRLLALIGNAGRTTAAVLSREVAMDKGLISRNIKTMVSDGLVRITLDPDDNRAQHLELSEAGNKMFTETLPRMRARQDALRALFDIEEEEVFNRVLDKLDRIADDRDHG
ncbi:MarR family winged helix-turn-helix transcriptional regulator [Sagittula salina]|uniref:Winged helix-turn-helix transcriptional regulator n=1 Tax=Sagittula salina TaxID=2820268 RepID=A0A940S304_9RHOB|nr:MarR family winged helix-turn-helix transcriptional regulator [Sagittula salina]MBP0482524.1 winged helix-turn-helix transcriptional regulator [Sagittula salina]